VPAGRRTDARSGKKCEIMVTKSLFELAEYLGGTVIGRSDTVVSGIRGIDDAGEGDITFVANPKYRKKLETTKASAVLVSPDITESARNLIVVDDPYVSLAKILPLFYPEERDPVRISDQASIDGTAEIAEEVTIYPGVYIGREAVIGKGAVLYPGVVVGNYVEIGEDAILYPNVSVYRRCRIGKRVILHAGVVVGSDGFGFANPGAENLKVSQIGIVQIDDDCEIGANTTIDRGALGKTWIQRGVKIDNLVQVGHNVVIGENTVIVSQVGISGSTKIGTGVMLGGQVGIVGHITIGDYAMVGAKSGVHRNVPPGQIVSGIGQMPHHDFLRTQACLPKLPDMRKTITSLLRKVEDLEAAIEKLTR